MTSQESLDEVVALTGCPVAGKDCDKCQAVASLLDELKAEARKRKDDLFIALEERDGWKRHADDWQAAANQLQDQQAIAGLRYDTLRRETGLAIRALNQRVEHAQAREAMMQIDLDAEKLNFADQYDTACVEVDLARLDQRQAEAEVERLKARIVEWEGEERDWNSEKEVVWTANRELQTKVRELEAQNQALDDAFDGVAMEAKVNALKDLLREGRALLNHHGLPGPLNRDWERRVREAL